MANSADEALNKLVLDITGPLHTISVHAEVHIKDGISKKVIQNACYRIDHALRQYFHTQKANIRDYEKQIRELKENR